MAVNYVILEFNIQFRCYYISTCIVDSPKRGKMAAKCLPLLAAELLLVVAIRLLPMILLAIIVGFTIVGVTNSFWQMNCCWS